MSQEINPDENDRQLSIVSAYQLLRHISQRPAPEFRTTTLKSGDSIDLLMVVKYPVRSMTDQERN
jgi:hypothetical protein